MRLSEAIRLGALLKAQGFGRYGVRADGPTAVRTCALGAAADAIGMLDRLMPVDDRAVVSLASAFPAEWHLLEESVIGSACPVCGAVHQTLAGVIAHVNDRHRWTREAIADWIE